MAVVLGVAVGVALPWYAAMTVQHGRAFLEVFFVQHHFGRFSSETLQHVRPVWFYVPVLMAGLFPWTPLTGLFDGGLWRDPRNRVWLWTAAFGVVFFSLSTNKLPGYLLPLFPAISVLLARALQAAAAAGKTLAVCAFLLALAPAIASLLPDALLNGLSRARMSEVHWEYLAVAAPFGLAAYWLDRRGWRVAAVSMIGALTVGALVYVKLSTAPVLGEVVSARGLARRLHGKAGEACVEGLHRNYRYGLEYYLRRELPDCEAAPGRRYGIVQEPGRLPQVTPR
jgi:4-amino-4-deoxy-L-arabinose transferase-like glycosyltransferase